MINSDIHNRTWNTIVAKLKSSNVNFGEVSARLGEQPYRATDTKVHPKILADWNRKGLLLSGHTANKMHRFSITEFAWIKLIEKMRAFNLPLEVIRTFKDEVLIGSPEEIEELWVYENLFNALMKMENGKNPDRIRAYLDRPETMKEAMANLPPGVQSGNLLETLVLFSLTLQTPVSFLIDHSGKATLFNPLMLMEGGYNDEETERIFTNSYVSISLSEVLADVLSLSDIETLHCQLMIVSDMEANVLQALREDDLTSVIIRYDKEHQMNLMEVKKLQKAERESRLLEMILKKGYQDITLKTQDGKVVYCENTRKIKLK